MVAVGGFAGIQQQRRLQSFVFILWSVAHVHLLSRHGDFVEAVCDLVGSFSYHFLVFLVFLEENGKSRKKCREVPIVKMTNFR